MSESQPFPSGIWPGISMVAVFSVVAFLFLASEVVIPLLFSVFLFFLLDPLIDDLKRLKMPRVVSAPLLVTLAFAIFCGLGWGTYRGIAMTARQLPEYSQKIRNVAQSIESNLARTNERIKNAFKIEKSEAPPPPLTNSAPPPTENTPSNGARDTHANSHANFQANFQANSQAGPAQGSLPGTSAGNSSSSLFGSSASGFAAALVQGVHSVFSFLASLIFIPILSIFFLLDRDRLRAGFSKSLKPEFDLGHFTRETCAMLNGYFIGSFVVGVVSSAAFYILFLCLGLDHRFSLSLFAGFMNLIPILGAVFGAVLPVAQALLQFGGVSGALIILAASGFLHVLVNNWVLPKIVGTRINVNASAATVGLLFFGWLWGAFGLLLAVPVTALIRIALSSHSRTRNLSHLLSSK